MNIIVRINNGKVDRTVRFLDRVKVDLIDDLLEQIQFIAGTSDKPIVANEGKMNYIVRFEEEIDFNGNITRYRYISPKEFTKPKDFGIDKMITECCDMLDISYEEMISGARDLLSSKKRKIIGYVLYKVGHYSATDIASRLMRSGTLVNTWINRDISNLIWTKDIETIDWINKFADKYNINSLKIEK